jgi:hypothetical protein
VPFTGDLKSLTLSTVLQILSSENKTGVLEIVRVDTKSSIYLKDGKIIAASSGQKHHQLGHLLCAKEIITPEQLRQAIEQSQKSGRRLGEVLLVLGFLSQDTLKEVVRHQVRETVLDLFLLEEGQFEFNDSPVQFDEDVFEEINAMEIMLEAARRMDEWAVIKKVIPSDTLVFKISEQATKESGKVSLETGEWRLVSMLDGSKSVREIIKHSGSGEFNVYKTLYAMATSKLINAVEKPTEPEKPVEEEGDDELAIVLPVYHDVVVTISRHLQDQLGQGYWTKILETCKGSLSPEGQQIVGPYQVNLSALENVNQVLAVVNKHHQGPGTTKTVGSGFNKLIACLLLQETEILGAKQTMQTIGRIYELLGVVEKYRGSEGKLRLVHALKETVSRVAARVGGKA